MDYHNVDLFFLNVDKMLTPKSDQQMAIIQLERVFTTSWGPAQLEPSHNIQNLNLTFTGQVLSTYRVNCAVPSWNDLWYFFGPLPSAFLGGPNEPPQIRATGFRSEVILNPPFGIGPGKIWSLSNPQCSSYSMCDRVILIWKLWVQDISKLFKLL